MKHLLDWHFKLVCNGKEISDLKYYADDLKDVTCKKCKKVMK